MDYHKLEYANEIQCAYQAYNTQIMLCLPKIQKSEIRPQHAFGLGEGPVRDYYDLALKQYCIKTIIH